MSFKRYKRQIIIRKFPFKTDPPRRKNIMQKNKGFTLIELLVVIAIIGILSSVVLASLNSARNKGADAAVKANLANLRAQAEIYYDSTGNSSYGTASTCTVTSGGTATGCTAGVATALVPGLTAAASASGNTSTMINTTTAWAASVALKAGGFYCVDSTGASKATAATITVSNC